LLLIFVGDFLLVFVLFACLLACLFAFLLLFVCCCSSGCYCCFYVVIVICCLSVCLFVCLLLLLGAVVDHLCCYAQVLCNEFVRNCITTKSFVSLERRRTVQELFEEDGHSRCNDQRYNNDNRRTTTTNIEKDEHTAHNTKLLQQQSE